MRLPFQVPVSGDIDISVSNVVALPPHILLGLTAGNVPAATARGYLAALHADFPALAESVAADLASTTLSLIENGHRDPQRLARDVRTVCSAAGGRWAR